MGRVKAVLKGFGLGLSFSPKPVGRLQGLRRSSRKMLLAFKPIRIKPPAIVSSSLAVGVESLSS